MSTTIAATDWLTDMMVDNCKVASRLYPRDMMGCRGLPKAFQGVLNSATVLIR